MDTIDYSVVSVYSNNGNAGMNVLEYVFWGLLGAIAHILVMRLWNEKTYLVREVGLSVVVSLVIWGFHLPNSFTAFGISFLGVDAIEAFLRRLVRRE